MRTRLLALLTVALWPAALTAGILVSRAHSGAGSATGESELTHLTADGRFVVFTSGAGDVVAVDTNNDRDVYLRDLLRGTVRLVSVNLAGTDSGDAQSFSGVASADGRYVAFASGADNLVTADTSGANFDVFRRDLQTGTTVLVSVNAAGTGSGNGQSFAPAMTPDGRFILFYSNATDLTALADSNNDTDLFLRDMQNGTTTLVSVNSAGTAAGNNGSPPFEAEISADGRYVAFTSYASNLSATSDGNGTADIFWRDLQASSAVLVSHNDAGTASGNGSSIAPSMTPDGRYVAFDTSATNLMSLPSSGFQVLVRDMQGGSSFFVSVNASHTAAGAGNSFKDPGCLSNDGRFVVFRSVAGNLVANDSNGEEDVFVNDLDSGTVTLVSVNQAGTASGNAASFTGAIAGGGRFVAFTSRATDLEPVDGNIKNDVFVRDLQSGFSVLASSNQAGTDGGNGDSASSLPLLISADGRMVAFESGSSDLVAGDANNNEDVFAFGVLRGWALAADSSGNGVLEAGETAAVAPSWMNDTGVPQSADGIANVFDGPAGPTYSLLDSAASYGALAAKQAKSCSAAGNCYSVSVTGSRPAFHWDATLMEALDLGQTWTWTLHLGDSFSDVPRGNGFYPRVETLLHHGVTNGCGISGNQLLYCPGQSSTREQMAKFVLVSKEGASYMPPACNPADARVFGDVPDSNGFCPFVEELFRRGVVNGCALNPLRYCPAGTVTREQMAKFVLKTLDPAINPPACTGGSEVFADVPAANGFCPFVEELFNRQVVNGCALNPLRYCPQQPVTREQMSKFLSLTFGLLLYGP